MRIGDKCLFRHTEADGLPNKKSENSGGKGSVALLKESMQLEPPKKSILRKKREIGIESRRHILQGYGAPQKNLGEKGSIARS